MNKSIFKATICIILISFTIIGCGRPRQEKDDVIVTVNGEKVYIKDLKRDLAISFKRDPFFRVTPKTLDTYLNMLIDKRLLIQEAKSKELDQTDRFVNTIKTFWEQTLIRDLMTGKDKEFEESVSVTEKEAQDYYDKLPREEGVSIASFDEMKPEIKEQIKKNKKGQSFDSWLRELREDADVKINDNVLKTLQYKYGNE